MREYKNYTIEKLTKSNWIVKDHAGRMILAANGRPPKTLKDAKAIIDYRQEIRQQRAEEMAQAIQACRSMSDIDIMLQQVEEETQTPTETVWTCMKLNHKAGNAWPEAIKDAILATYEKCYILLI